MASFPIVLSMWAFSRAASFDIVQLSKKQPAQPIVSASLHDRVVNFNRYIFHDNVLKPIGENSADHWVVMFCPPWWEMCQRMYEPFAQASGEWQGKLNNALMTRDVRFAQVDCATDKPLCNEQDVEGYPTVHHYSGGQRVATWNGGRKNDPERFTKWLTGQFADLSTALQNGRDRASLQTEPTLSGVADGARKTLKQLSPGAYTVDAFLIIGILALVSSAVNENPKVWQTHGKQCSSRMNAPDSTLPSSDLSDSGGAVVLDARTGVARFLPGEWANARPSIEL